MELPFWSVHEESGVTSNMLAIATMSVIDSDNKVILAENHHCINNIGNRIMFSGYKEELKEGNFCSLRYGNSISEDLIEVLAGRLFYLMPFPVSKGYFEHYFYHNILPQFKKPDMEDELIMIDTDINGNVSTQKILHDSKLVVVNVCQDSQKTEFFLTEYGSIIKKAIFVIGQYKRCRLNNVRRLLMEAGVTMDRIAVIPRNDDFEISMLEGRGVEFIKNNYDCRKNSDNYYFITELKQTTRKILNKVNRVRHVKRTNNHYT